MFETCARAFGAALLAALLSAAPAQAQQLLDSYAAHLSARDHFNSNGERLRSAAAIIRQDRANYHRFGLRDPADEGDRFFADMENRAAMERLLSRGRISPAAERAIVDGEAYIAVEVYGRAGVGDSVRVVVID